MVISIFPHIQPDWSSDLPSGPGSLHGRLAGATARQCAVAGVEVFSAGIVPVVLNVGELEIIPGTNSGILMGF